MKNTEVILSLLKATQPFQVLPEIVQLSLVDMFHEMRFSKDTLVYRQHITDMDGVDLIEQGEYETFFLDSSDGKRLIEIHHRPYCFGGISVLLNRTKALKSVIAKKGTVIYRLPRKNFIELCNANEEFFHFFTNSFGRRMLDEEFSHFVKSPASFEESYFAADQLYSRKIEHIVYKDIVACSADTPIYMAAKMMATQKVSCLFIKAGDSIIGYATDMTLRDRVIAQQADTGQHIVEVMDNPIVSISNQAYLYEAVLKMFRTKSKYLLVEKEGNYVGFLSRNRLLSEQGQSPLVFIQSVKLAETLEELRDKWNNVPEIIHQLLGRGVNAEIANQVITTVADSIAIKVIEKVIKDLGEPPAKFVFMVTGSEGRKEQTLMTDQDNAIIYENKANEQRELVRDYFLRFASQVSDHLNTIGFSYCTGGYMASNPEWTHSLSHWKNNYKTWIEESIPENAIKFSTFFDCRRLYGDPNIIEQLKDFLTIELQKPNDRFFAFIAKNALQYEPPLTFFKTIKTQTVGSTEVFNIKKAMTPIVDLVRVYALKNRIYEENTGGRLKALLDLAIFTQEQYDELHQSYYYLMSLRLRNQANQIRIAKLNPNNYIPIDSLTKIEKATLKEIFKTIHNFQIGIRLKFTNNIFG
ncbi:MAG: signal transduction protein [Sphingobacterium sp.]|jgi:CBS domain-containing protein|nr:signal transduction protein [Sphingobacterium sp.]